MTDDVKPLSAEEIEAHRDRPGVTGAAWARWLATVDALRAERDETVNGIGRAAYRYKDERDDALAQLATLRDHQRREGRQQLPRRAGVYARGSPRPVVHAVTGKEAPGWRVVPGDMSPEAMRSLADWAGRMGDDNVCPAHFLERQIELSDGTFVGPDCSYVCSACGACIGCVRRVIDPLHANYEDDEAGVVCSATDNGKHVVLPHNEELEDDEEEA